MTKNSVEQLPAGATRQRRPATKPAAAKPRRPAGEVDKRTKAIVAANGVLGSAQVLIDFAAVTLGDLSLFDTAMVLRAAAQTTLAGRSNGMAELMLTAQASALNAIFVDMARRAAVNVGSQDIVAVERFLHLALKAQEQSRVTWEALATFKNLPAPGGGAAASATQSGSTHG